MTICETQQGVRLRAEPVLLTAKPEDDADEVFKQIEAAARKRREKITDIVAVPPLVNNSLTREADYLQGVIAQFIERARCSVAPDCWSSNSRRPRRVIEDHSSEFSAHLIMDAQGMDVVRCGKGVDVFYCGRGLCVMRKPGLLEELVRDESQSYCHHNGSKTLAVRRIL